MDEKLKKKFLKKQEDQMHEVWGCSQSNPKYCKTCIFSKGNPPFEDSPLKANCMIYTHKSGVDKPASVYYEGARCDFYNDGKNIEEDEN